MDINCKDMANRTERDSDRESGRQRETIYVALENGNCDCDCKGDCEDEEEEENGEEEEEEEEEEDGDLTAKPVRNPNPWGRERTQDLHQSQGEK